MYRSRALVRAALLNALYPIPAPVRSAEEADKYHHRDLRKLSREALLREEHSARFRWAFAESTLEREWLTSRLEAIREALRNGN